MIIDSFHHTPGRGWLASVSTEKGEDFRVGGAVEVGGIRWRVVAVEMAQPLMLGGSKGKIVGLVLEPLCLTRQRFRISGDSLVVMDKDGGDVTRYSLTDVPVEHHDDPKYDFFKVVPWIPAVSDSPANPYEAIGELRGALNKVIAAVNEINAARGKEK